MCEIRWDALIKKMSTCLFDACAQLHLTHFHQLLYALVSWRLKTDVYCMS